MPSDPNSSAAAPPSLRRGALAGLAAGVAASLAMDVAQRALAALSPSDDREDAPATEKIADRASIAATGRRVPDAARPAAGQAVHYAEGTALGIGYGIAAEYLPHVTAGFGAGFGAATALVLDEGAVPLARLGPPPTDTPLGAHAYGLVSHLVFGTTAEGVRRIMRAALREPG